MTKPSTFRQFLLVLSLALPPELVRAHSWFVPRLDDRQEIQVFNPSNTDLEIWVAPPQRDPEPWTERRYDLPARQSLRFLPEEWPDEPWLQIKAREASVRVLVKTPGQWIPVPEGRASRRRLVARNGIEAVSLANLSPIRQDGLIQTRSPSGGLVSFPFQLESFQTRKVTVDVPPGTEIRVMGAANLQATALVRDRAEFMIPEVEPLLPAGGVRFVLANGDRSQSFVVEISDPELIRQAREQIRSPGDFRARILIGEIGTGSGGVNQDLDARYSASWSWHVSRVLTFAEFASIACDGSPEFVEDFLLAWLGSRSPICFWNYRIIREL